jgi:hypothetical protein
VEFFGGMSFFGVAERCRHGVRASSGMRYLVQVPSASQTGGWHSGAVQFVGS